MSSGDTGIKLNGIKNQLKAIEKQCNSSSLFIYTPKLEHRQFINDLCRIYLDAPHRERWLVRDAVSGSKGVLNCLLGHVYESAKQVLSTDPKPDFKAIGSGIPAAFHTYAVVKGRRNRSR